MKRKAINIGTVSSGTMCEEDLIPDFVWELRSQTPCRHTGLCNQIERAMERDGYFGSEDASYDLEDLFDALNEYAPEWFYFGAHPGDGSDYGYWLSESFEDDFDGLKVSDLAEIPADYVGQVAVVNDHGNITLYNRGRDHQLYELWSIV